MLSAQRQRLHAQIAEWCALHPLLCCTHPHPPHVPSPSYTPLTPPFTPSTHPYTLLHPCTPPYARTPLPPHRYVRVFRLRVDEGLPTDDVIRLVADHYSRSAEEGKARRYLVAAGRIAVSRGRCMHSWDGAAAPPCTTLHHLTPPYTTLHPPTPPYIA